MKIRKSFELAIGSIISNKMRSFLTMLGIISRMVMRRQTHGSRIQTAGAILAAQERCPRMPG